MKKIFTIITIVICVLMAGCGKPAPTTKTVPVPAPDTWPQQMHQGGEVQIAPGESFTVSLTPDSGANRIWEESPEIINPSVIEKVDYKSEPAAGATVQTWTFKGLAKGSCVLLFKTSGKSHEVFEWTYSLFVGIKSTAAATLNATGTLTQTGNEVSDANIDFPGMLYTQTENDTFELKGTLEGKMEAVALVEVNLQTGVDWLVATQETFTGTMNGKSGTLDIFKVGWGVLKPPDYKIGRFSSRGIIIGGTGELANLRGTMNDDFLMTGELIPPGNYSYTIWWLD